LINPNYKERGLSALLKAVFLEAALAGDAATAWLSARLWLRWWCRALADGPEQCTDFKESRPTGAAERRFSLKLGLIKSVEARQTV
jgi:hypothetical protein